MPMNSRTILLLLSLCCNMATPSFSVAQSAVDWFQRGENLLLQGQPQKAISALERALKLRPDMQSARRYLGLCYELLKDYPRALSYYIEVTEQDSLFSRAIYFQIGELCYKTGQYVLATQYFERYKAMQQKPVAAFSLRGEREAYEEASYLLRLPSLERACQIALDSIKLLNVSHVQNIGGKINTRADEYFPALSNNRQLLLYTRRLNKNADEDLYFSILAGTQWQTGAPVESGINTKHNEGMPTLVRNGRRLFFTACGREQVLGPCDIWEADLDPEIAAITGMRPLKGALNTERWESQATVSCDGSTLYFASNRPGGLGGTDIWMSERQPDGAWGPARNLGDKINSSGDEEAPFITSDGKALYFSSNGHPGLGEQDLFVAWKDANDRWTSPINLGPRVNTAYRELGFFLSADGQTAYFASDRPDGYGGMDIYFFQLSEQLYSDPITLVEGFVKDSILGIPLQVNLDIEGRGTIPTDKDGRFFLCVPAGDILHIRTERRFYHPFQQQYPIPRWDNKDFYTIDLLLQPIQPPGTVTTPAISADTSRAQPVIRPKNRREITHAVYFDFDKSTISAESQKPLAEFTANLKSKDVVRVNIVGFADDIGADLYNLRLSEERAKQVAVFLLQNQITVDQIFIEGRGEVRNAGPREKNRRVDIRVVIVE